ncbi:MAG: TetR/AcrR family transcriptional regulator [Vicinamibacteria bacterium]
MSAPPAAAPPSQESLLEAATREFMTAGFAGARVDAIARRAKANKAMIYYHFGSKEGLYRAVLLRHFGGVLSEIERLVAEEPDPLRRLARIYAGIAHVLEERPALAHIMVREILAGGQHMAPEVRKTLTTIVGLVRRTIEEGVAKGALRPADPWIVHLSMIAPLLFHRLTAPVVARALPGVLAGVEPPSADAMLAHLARVLELSLAPDKESR